jgi:hypothetical protein
MGTASCYGDPIQQVQAAIGRALRDEGDPTQPLPDRLTALAKEIEYLNGRTEVNPTSPMPLKAPGRPRPGK